VAGVWWDTDGDGNYEVRYNNSVYTGAYNFKMKMNSPNTSEFAKQLLAPTFSAYCIDVIQVASWTYRTYTITDLWRMRR